MSIAQQKHTFKKNIFFSIGGPRCEDSGSIILNERNQARKDIRPNT